MQADTHVEAEVAIVGAGGTGRRCFAAAAKRGVPLRLLDIDPAVAQPVYGHKLVLVRPDQHVALRSDAEPGDALALIDLVRAASA
jgi:hypothetical protein